MQSLLFFQRQIPLKRRISRLLYNFNIKHKSLQYNVTAASTRPLTMATNRQQFHSSQLKYSIESKPAVVSSNKCIKSVSSCAKESINITSRYYCSNNNKPEPEEEAIIEDTSADNSEYVVRDVGHLPATVAVPEVWPHVPLVPVSRNPIFPRFMKIIEVQYNYLCSYYNN